MCSPPKPDNLWAEIRKNHGVQISKQFLGEIFKTIGASIFDIGDITTLGDEELFKGIPNTTLEKVRNNPTGNILCFTSTDAGHCVTPYEVISNRMNVYDNNVPSGDMQFIDIVNGDYEYPARSKDPNHGNFIIAYPLSLWEEGRSLWGLGDFLKLPFNDQILDFLAMILSGSADMVITNEDGERYGWEDDDSFSRSMAGVLTTPPFGPSEEPNRNGIFLLSTSQPKPEILINADGGLYAFHTGAGDQLFQLEAMHAQLGDKDRIKLAYSSDRIDGFSFQPQRNATSFVTRAGLDFGDEEGVVFSWLGLSIPGGEKAGFTANKDAHTASYANDTGSPSHYVLSLDYASGPADSYGRSIYGPIEVPAGATHTARLASWPEVDSIISELDFDRDGIPDHSEEVPGRPAMPPSNPALSADLAVTKETDTDVINIGEAVTYTIKITNNGPEIATAATLIDSLPSHVTISNIQTDRGGCIVETTGLKCDFGDMVNGDIVTVIYSATPSLPGFLVNGAFVYSELDDSNWTNNTAIVTTDTCEGTDCAGSDIDSDGDTIADRVDNCTLVPNQPQHDTDSDNFGDACDPDFNQNGIVDQFDFSQLKACFGSTSCPLEDLNSNGIVDQFDFSRLKSMFGQPPGPSALIDN